MKNYIQYELLSRDNFSLSSLDTYRRFQDTKVNLRLVEGKYVYVEDPFFEDWNEVELRKRAKSILEAIDDGSIGFLAKHEDQIVGFAYLGSKLLGSEKQYIDLIMFHVSYEYRNQGIGTQLFRMICDQARKIPAKKIYISANSAKETQEAYKALGCVFASEIQEEIAAHEPFDIQLEFIL